MTPRKDLLDIAALSQEEIVFILDNTKPFKQLFTKSVKKVPPLRGQTVLLLFYEPSTRTSSSFEVAAKRLSADVINLQVKQSSVVKGESVLDTVATLEAMKVDYIIVRHSAAGVPGLIARNTDASVVNAGDGAHAHPTQALLDAFTLREAMPDLTGKRILVAGDLLHSRVARSTMRIMHQLGLEVGILGPGSLVPRHRPEFVKHFRTFDAAFAWNPDVIYLLRVQSERQSEQFFPSVNEYHRNYGLTETRLAEVEKRGIWVMHPGPVNRGMELADAVMGYERCLINQQVENGIAVRMSVLYWLQPNNGETV